MNAVRVIASSSLVSLVLLGLVFDPLFVGFILSFPLFFGKIIASNATRVRHNRWLLIGAMRKVRLNLSSLSLSEDRRAKAGHQGSGCLFSALYAFQGSTGLDADQNPPVLVQTALSARRTKTACRACLEGVGLKRGVASKKRSLLPHIRSASVREI